MSMFSSQQQQAEWKPRTTLGQQVLAGKITSMDQIYENGLRIQESEIVKHFIRLRPQFVCPLKQPHSLGILVRFRQTQS